ncbi:hypothetical protein SB14R_10280 [Pseudomonas oryzihabitans]|nr:hypothetical protein SB14R_10280 [Pseudomonas psychrotolerans]
MALGYIGTARPIATAQNMAEKIAQNVKTYSQSLFYYHLNLITAAGWPDVFYNLNRSRAKCGSLSSSFTYRCSYINR